MPCSSYTLTLTPSFPKIVHPGKSSYFKVLYTCYFASSITPGFSGHMMPLVLILQSLINNQDNFEQHLSSRRSIPPPRLGLLPRSPARDQGSPTWEGQRAHLQKQSDRRSYRSRCLADWGGRFCCHPPGYWCLRRKSTFQRAAP